MLVKYVSDCCAFLQLGLFLGGNSSDNLEEWSFKFVAKAFPRGFARGESFAKPKKNQNSIQPSWAFRGGYPARLWFYVVSPENARLTCFV